MPQIGDVLQVNVRAQYQLQTVLNTFFYRVMDNPSTGWRDGFLTEFKDTVLTPMRVAQVPDVGYRDIYVRNIFDGEEFTDDIPTLTGTNGSTLQRLPSFIAAHIRLTRGNNRVRHGHKYLAGQTEDHTAGQIWGADYQVMLQNVADGMASDLNAGGSVDVWKPVIVGRILQPQTDKPPFYRLPTSQAEMGENWAYVTGARADTAVTTMRSRKAGHGV